MWPITARLPKATAHCLWSHPLALVPTPSASFCDLRALNAQAARAGGGAGGSQPSALSACAQGRPRPRFQAPPSLLKGGSLTWNEMSLHLPSSTQSGDKHSPIPKRPRLRQGTDRAVHLGNRARGGDGQRGRLQGSQREVVGGPTWLQTEALCQGQGAQFPRRPTSFLQLRYFPFRLKITPFGLMDLFCCFNWPSSGRVFSGSRSWRSLREKRALPHPLASSEHQAGPGPQLSQVLPGPLLRHHFARRENHHD